MGVAMETVDNAEWVSFRLEGTYDFARVFALIGELRAACDRLGKRRALVDIRGLAGDVPNLDRFNLGKRFGEVWDQRYRVAIISPRNDQVKLFENTAVNRQSRVLVGNDEPAAMAWLEAG